MSQLDTPQGYKPPTFHERGVYIPLTTPMLTGARVRLVARAGLQLVVPKAPGGRGNYLCPWSDVGDLCELTVHDTRLLERIGKSRYITPASVREVGWQCLAEGFAGRPARIAAQAAQAADEAARIHTYGRLQLALVRAMDPASLRNGTLTPAQLTPRVSRATLQMAAQLGCGSTKISEAFARLAPLLASLGLGERVGVARVPALLVAIQALRQSMAALHTASHWEADAVKLITHTADITLSCLTGTLAEARSLAEATPKLLKAWIADPAGTVELVSRAEWLADGWAWLCRLWSTARDIATQRHTLEEIVLVLPTIPDEVAQWPGFGAETHFPRPIARISLPADHGEARLAEATQRNEQLLAFAT